MARKYDIIERLKSKNERPFVALDKDHSYEINTSKTNVMHIMAMSSDVEDDDENGIKFMDQVIEVALGKEASKYIASQDYTMAVYEDILNVIFAAIGDKDLEDVEETEKK